MNGRRCSDCDTHPHGVCWRHDPAVRYLENQPPPPDHTPPQRMPLWRLQTLTRGIRW